MTKQPKYEVGDGDDEVYARSRETVTSYHIRDLNYEEYNFLRSIIVSSCHRPHLRIDGVNLTRKLLTKEDHCKIYNLPI